MNNKNPALVLLIAMLTHLAFGQELDQLAALNDPVNELEFF